MCECVRKCHETLSQEVTDSHCKRTSSSSRVHVTRAKLRINQFYLSIMLARTIPPARADIPHHCAAPASSHYRCARAARQSETQSL